MAEKLKKTIIPDKPRKRSRPYFFYYTKAELAGKTKNSEQTGYKWKNVTYNDTFNVWMLNNKPIIAKEDITTFLTNVYNDPQSGLIGRDKLFAKIYASFAGVPKRDVAAFLKNHETHQLHQIPKKEAVVKPIVIKAPHKYLQVDLIDKSALSKLNQGYNWLFTCVDLFSKYAFVIPLKHKTTVECRDAMAEIIDQMPDKRVTVVQSDRGAEFQGEFDEFLAEKKIKHLLSRSYTPQSQGSIESFNKTFKLMLERFFTSENSYHYIDVLPLLVKNYNSNIHSTTGKRPEDLHNKRLTDEETTDAKHNIMREAKKRVENVHFDKLKIGEFVRVLRVRHRDYEDKPGKFVKKTIKNWSDEIYEIVKVHSNNIHYELKNVETDEEEPNAFKRDHLLHIPSKTPITGTKQRKDYSERSGVKSFDRQRFNRDMAKNKKIQRELDAANGLDEHIDEEDDEDEPMAARRSTRARKAPDRYAP